MKTDKIYISDTKELTINYTIDNGRYVVRSLFLYDDGNEMDVDPAFCDVYDSEAEMFEQVGDRF